MCAALSRARWSERWPLLTESDRILYWGTKANSNNGSKKWSKLNFLMDFEFFPFSHSFVALFCSLLLLLSNEVENRSCEWEREDWIEVMNIFHTIFCFTTNSKMNVVHVPITAIKHRSKSIKISTFIRCCCCCCWQTGAWKKEVR